MIVRLATLSVILAPLGVVTNQNTLISTHHNLVPANIKTHETIACILTIYKKKNWYHLTIRVVRLNLH